MNVKKNIAREWLFLLGFAAIGLVVVPLCKFVFAPTEVLYESESTLPKDALDGQAIKLHIDTLLYREYLRTRPVLPTPEENMFDILDDVDRMLELEQVWKLRDSIYKVAVANWQAKRYAWDTYGGEKRRVDDRSRLAIFIPYLLFLFGRSIVWAFQNVRKKPA